MNNISHISDCFGCGVCVVTCPRKIIVLELNHSGFYEPKITDADNCTQCGMCIEVCAFLDKDLSLTKNSIHSYAAWSKNKAVRRKCSSGGLGFEIGRTLIDEGYKICGVRYNYEKNQAEHYIANTIQELIASCGSKYIQSYTVDGFKSINRKEKYLVTGTPCQIDSFRRYIQKFHCEENFILVDFFCHGVPSKLIWDKYLKYSQKQVGKITYVAWRYKQTSWNDSWITLVNGEEIESELIDWHDSFSMLINGDKRFLHSRLSQGDLFYTLFLSDMCLGKACYKQCKYKYDRSAADIRIGDLWGNTYESNKEGVSAVVTFTSVGHALLSRCNCQFIEHSFEVVAEGQMKENPWYSILVPISITIIRTLPISLSKYLVSFNVKAGYKLKKWFGI